MVKESIYRPVISTEDVPLIFDKINITHLIPF